VIALAPGSPEALKFLRLILLSKRGPDAEAERAAELENCCGASGVGARGKSVVDVARERAGAGQGDAMGARRNLRKAGKCRSSVARAR
jgi:hypothetical protein